LDTELSHSVWAADACSFRDRSVTTRVYPRVFKLSSFRQCFYLLVLVVKTALKQETQWGRSYCSLWETFSLTIFYT